MKKINLFVYGSLREGFEPDERIRRIALDKIFENEVLSAYAPRSMDATILDPA